MIPRSARAERKWPRSNFRGDGHDVDRLAAAEAKRARRAARNRRHVAAGTVCALRAFGELDMDRVHSDVDRGIAEDAGT